MKAPRGTALVLAVLVLAGCGSGGTKARRNAVNAYFADVGQAQVDIIGRQAQIATALQKFSLTQASPAELAALRDARLQVNRALGKVRALRPPSDARHLHALIVQRFALQRSVLDELIATELYLPKLAAATVPVHAATAALRAQLAALASPGVSVNGGPTVAPVTKGPPLAQYAAAFGGYGDALRPVNAKLATLKAPPILGASQSAERAALSHSILYCDRIRQALERRDIPAANAAIHSLFSVSSALNGARTRQQQAAAARAYDARLHRIDVLAVKANAERERLVKLIG